MTDHSALVSKVWNYAHVLRDAGIPYSDYVEQITYLLFLKMDEERSRLIGEPSLIPPELQWTHLRGKSGEELDETYRTMLTGLAKLGEGTLLGAIYARSQNKIGDPAKLRRIVSMIDEETWIGIDVDVKGAIYEGLLERNAGEVKSGAGQYFTPRPLIQAIVEVVDPRPGATVCDPACGTGGFLCDAYSHMRGQTRDRDSLLKLRDAFTGYDIVREVVRLCAMNLYLHGITPASSPIIHRDALMQKDARTYDYVLTNPPFGRKQSYRTVGEDGEIEVEREDYERDDFIVTTSNKQLNFLQHIMSIMSADGHAAVVLPDNVLFETGGGERIRRKLLDQFDFHTLLRLPTGIFYKPGVKANVLFFDAKPASRTPWTKALWVYDFRTNQHFTLKERPLRRAHLDEFVAAYRVGDFPSREETERFRRFTYEDLVARDRLNLDIFWLKDDSLTDPEHLPPPSTIAAEIVESLEAALEQFRAVAAELGDAVVIGEVPPAR